MIEVINKIEKEMIELLDGYQMKKIHEILIDDNDALFVSLLKPYNKLQISGVEIRLRQLGKN